MAAAVTQRYQAAPGVLRREGRRGDEPDPTVLTSADSLTVQMEEPSLSLCLSVSLSVSMNVENRPPVTAEPVEFQGLVQEIYPSFLEEFVAYMFKKLLEEKPRKMSPCKSVSLSVCLSVGCPCTSRKSCSYDGPTIYAYM